MQGSDEGLVEGDALSCGPQIGAAQGGEDRRVEHLDRNRPADRDSQVRIAALGLERLPQPEVLLEGEGDRAAAEQVGRQLSAPEHPGG